MSGQHAEGSIEKTYQKKTQLEHILLRPDTYIGTVEKVDEKLWVYDIHQEKLVYKQITYVPGLYKIFDEILVNAVDNITRDLSMNTIKVSITSNSISIYNNGKGIPVNIHKTYKIYVPELIFGHLLTSSNYDDSIKKITGGRNGFGAKLTNIFSKKFTVETAEKKAHKSFKMEFSNNMLKHSEAEINEKYSGEDYTKITFEPDLKKFRMSELDEDIQSLLMKRVYDVAGTTPSRINVYLNNKKIHIKTFNDYIDLYLKGNLFDEKIEYPKLVFPGDNERWEVAVSMTDNAFQQVSFVNGICTIKGGTHVNYIVDQITEKISEHMKKKYKDIKMNSNQIKQNLWIFINCFIENPSFDSQTKETLTLKQSNFGSKCELTEAFLGKIIKSPIVSNIVEFGKAKNKVKLNRALSSNIKKASRLLGIEKLEDANLAGSKDSLECTLIITEGDSAKALAMAGIEVAGRDKFGVFPIKGKLLNVRSCQDKKIIDNQEIQNIIKILGLKMNMDYTDELKGLRYGKLMIMTDQDYDGSHIKGLIINFIHCFWPSLLIRGNFIQEFITPIIKVSKLSKEFSFFTIKDYNDWFVKNNITGWHIKYYKGLGTSTTKEAKEYFNNLNKNRINFIYENKDDDQAIELAFAKTDTVGRKNWLMQFDPLNTFIDHSIGKIRYKDFIDKELIFFSNYDNVRSIPSLIDGLKPSERKILYGCFKRNLRQELKVAQLTGYIAEHSSYHHGEMSLSQTIIALAQDFVGSNNLNLLLPIGQFGSRYNGIKGAASPRYIFTSLNPLTRKLFPEEDDSLLMYNVDEGTKIEPIWYAPIIPSLLINGAEGIGTGWSTSVPQYNPIDLAKYILSKINNETEIRLLKPWYRGYTGEIKPQVEGSTDNYIISGRIRINSDNLIEITELPIHTWIRDYKTFLEKNHIDNKETKTKEFEVEDIKEYHSGNKILFHVKLSNESLEKVKNISEEELIKLFKLSSSISTSNMVLFDSNNKIKKYSNVEEMIDEFYNVRLVYYEKRRDYLIAKYGFNFERNENKMKFIQYVLNNEIPFNKAKNKSEILSLMKSKGLLTMKDLKAKYHKAFEINSTEMIINEEAKDHSNPIVDNNDFDYDYLMNMNIWSLTPDKITELSNAIAKDKSEYDYLLSGNALVLWKFDLVTFIEVYQKHLNEIDGENLATLGNIEKMKLKSQMLRKAKKGKRGTSNGNITKKKKKKEEDSFLDDDDENEDSDQEDNNYSEYSDDNGVGDDNEKAKAKGNTNSNSNSGSDKKNKSINNKETKKRLKRNPLIRTENSSYDISIEEEDEIEDDNKKSFAKKKRLSKETKESIASITKAGKKNGKASTTSTTKKKNVIEDEEMKPIDEQPIGSEASSFLKTLNMDNKNLTLLINKDPSQLSLKERLALRAKQGQIDEYFKAKNSVLEPIGSQNEITNEDIHNDFLRNKTLPKTSIISSTTKKKKLIKKGRKKESEEEDDDDNDDDETYN